MDVGLDDKDLKVLEALKENSKLSTQKISKKTLIPITTVHNRIKKLTKLGIIKQYTVRIDDKKMGAICAFIIANVDSKALKDAGLTPELLAKKLKKNSSVQQVCMVTGGIDVLIKVSVKNIGELENLVTSWLRNIEGITNSHTMIVLNEF